MSAHVVVLGAGLAGTAAARSIAARGHRVTVLERFEAGHVRGSSHGQERIFRISYDDPTYVRLGLAARTGWAALEAETGIAVFHPVGMLDHGEPDRLDALEATGAATGVTLARIPASEAATRWPGLRFEGDVLVQDIGGWLAADRALSAFTLAAERHGAEFAYEDPALDVTAHGPGWRVRTATSTLDADAVVVATAGWTPALLGDLAEAVALPPITVTTEVAAWFAPQPDGPTTTWPCWCHRIEPERYGLPAPDGLVKLAEHGTGLVSHPDERSFTPPPESLDRLRAYAAEWIPGVVPEVVRATTCLYASTPTDDLVLDRAGSLVVGVGLGGHGFKFGPAVGDRLADLTDDALAS